MSDEILGATIVGTHAGDIINLEGIRQTGDAYNPTRLTPFVRGLFRTWLARRQ